MLNGTFEDLKRRFGEEAEQSVTHAVGHTKAMSEIAYAAIRRHCDAQHADKRQVEATVAVRGLGAAAQINDGLVQTYARAGYLLTHIPELLDKVSWSQAKSVLPIVTYDRVNVAWSIDALHLQKIQEWVSGNERSPKSIQALRAACGKSVTKTPPTKPDKPDAPATPEQVAPVAPPVVTPEERRNGWLKAFSEVHGNEETIDEMVIVASDDQKALIAESVGKHASAEVVLRLVREWLFAHGEEPDCLLALYEIGKDLELAQVTKVAEGYIAQQGEDADDGPEYFKRFTHAIKEAAKQAFQQQPVAA